ncbi:MAG TPA: hypothetical protein VGM23_08885 [Armatimonadota bacterium]
MKKLLLLGLLLATSFAFAVPTQLGFSGGFTVPTAEIQQGVSLTMIVDETENFSMGAPMTMSATEKLPQTLLTFGFGKSFEACIGYHKRELNFGGPSIDFSTTNASLKYALPWTIRNGKLAIGVDYDTTSSGMTTSRWIGLLSGTFPAFNKDTTFTASMLFPSGDTYPVATGGNSTGYGFALERKLPNKGTVGVEYIFNSPNYYHVWENDFGTIYATVPFSDMFTGRLALTGINDEAKLAYSLTANF